jgi:outer membrane receptor protein involved in Fe transport
MCVWAVLSLIGAGIVYSQAVSGSLIGTVTDTSGASIPDAKIKVVEVNTGKTRNVATSTSGAYVITNLDPGAYRLEVEQPGFRKSVRENVVVLVNNTTRIDLELQTGVVTETVDVIASAAILQTDRADTGRKFETVQVENVALPFNRNFQGLIGLVPGAARPFRPHSEFFNSEDSLSTHVNGQSRLLNNVQFEGVDNNHRTGLLTVLIPPIEAIQSVDITTSNYEAELGRAGGAVENVILRSGTNSIHGSVYEFNKVSRLGAKNFFATTKPVTTYNYYGFTVGGPIRKNKTFFFGDFLGVRDRRGDSNLKTIPSTAYRAGDFTSAPSTIYDPATGSPDGTGRTPFPGNIIPTNRISPLAQKLLALVPPPTRPGNGVNFEKGTVRQKDTDSFDVKVDHSQTERDKFAVRYSYQKPKVFDPPLFGVAGGGGKGFAGTGTNKTQSAAVNYTHILSPSFISELRVGLSRYRNDAQNFDLGTNASEAIGIKGVNLDPVTSGLTSIDVTGLDNPFIGYSASVPWVRAETNLNFVTNWTKIRGNHTFKWGADVRHIRDALSQSQDVGGVRGQFNFRNGTTALKGGPSPGAANAFASFLLDIPNSYARDLTVYFPEYLQWQTFVYGQDKWQVTPKLTVDLGLRWEFYPPATPRFAAGFSNYDWTNNSLVLAGVGGNPSNLGRKTYWNNWAPRFGFAYRFSEKTVLRGGYGISYAPYPDNQYAYNFPVRQNNVYNAPNSDGFRQAVLPNGQLGAMSVGFLPPIPAVIPSNGIISPAPLGSDYNVIPLDYHEPYVQAYNLTIQRSLPKNFVMELSYVGNHGVRMPVSYNLNAATVAGLGAAGQPLFQKFGKTTKALDKYFPSSSTYNSFQLKFDRRFSGGFLMTTAYTYSKSIDYANDNGDARYYIDYQRNRARSDFDRAHVFVQSYIWQLPFGKGKRWANSGVSALVAGGWELIGVLSLQTGAPLNFIYNNATLNTPGNGDNSPNINGPLQVLHGVGSKEFWFDTSVFSAPATGKFGSVGRNVLSGPGFRNLDFSVFRTFRINERANVQFRAESYNFTNTPAFNNPNTEFGNANFGHITLSGDCGSSTGYCFNPRVIQLGLKLTF